MRIHQRRPNKLLAAGLMALAVANTLGYLLRRTPALSESVTDPVSGFLYGVAIALVLIGIRRQVRANDGDGLSC